MEGAEEMDMGELSRRVGVNIIRTSMTYNFSSIPFIVIKKNLYFCSSGKSKKFFTSVHQNQTSDSQCFIRLVQIQNNQTMNHCS